MSDSVEKVQATLQQTMHDDDAREVHGNVVTGWVVVAESMAPDGRRWLSRMSGGPGGEPLPEWTSEGLLHNALYGGGWDG